MSPLWHTKNCQCDNCQRWQQAQSQPRAVHPDGCQCTMCQDARFRQHYGYAPARPGHHGGAWIVLIIFIIFVLVGLFLATVASWGDPHLDFPVISQTVCSIKGDTWYGGGIHGAPGCYTPSP